MLVNRTFGEKTWRKKLEFEHNLNQKHPIFSDSRVRIYVLPIPKFMRPDRSPFAYPKYSQDWGVEQDFELAVLNSPTRVFNPEDATHHYLPVYWTRYWVQNNYGKTGMRELMSSLEVMNVNEAKLFTVCQYDDGPLVDLNFGRGLYLASRKSEKGNDIPLLASPFPKMYFTQGRKTKVLSFDGRISTHPVRQRMLEEIGHLPGVQISDQVNSTRAYYKSLTSSYVSLAPRGYGGSSFRFFEAMQVATVPALIGNLDTRPFKEFVNWDEISFFAESPTVLYEKVTSCSLEMLQEMAEKAHDVYWDKLAFGKWTVLMWQKLLLSSEIDRE